MPPKPPPSSRRRFDQFRRELKDLRRRHLAGDRDAFRRHDDSSPPPLDDEQRRAQRLKRRGYLRQYIGWLKPFFPAFAGILVLAAIVAAANSVIPLAGGLIVDRLLLNESLDADARRQWLLTTSAGLLVLIVIAHGIDLVRFFRMHVLNAKIVFRLRKRLYDHLMHLPLQELSQLKVGGVTSRLTSDVDQLTGLVQMGLLSPAIAMLRLVVVLGIVFWWNWRLALIIAVLVPGFALVSGFWIRRIRPIWRAAHHDRSDVNARVTETFGGLRVVRAFRREPRETLDYTLGHHLIIRKHLLAYAMAAVVDAFWEALIPVVGVCIICYGGWLYLTQGTDGASIGQIMAFHAYSAMLLFPIYMIVRSFSQMQQALAALERVFDVLETGRDKPDRPDAVPAPDVIDRMRFETVTFAYEPDRPVLREINLDVPGGSVVALVGPSGAGKTTFVDLVARFYDPVAGRITLNGTDLRDIQLDSYRSLLGVVSQDVFLFDGTIRDNIAYGRRDAPLPAVADAARRANAAEFIEELPGQYDALIGERGVKLSGGQRQRLSIARAILADPRILILDEATSNLDSESERLIQQALADLIEHRTTFVIAHRLSTVTHADQIVVLDRGRIVATGQHNELMGRAGLYRDMVLRQSESLGEMRGTLV